MTFYEHIAEFAGKPVQDWTADTGIANPEGTVYRIALDWDENEAGQTWTDKLASFLEDPSSERVTGLVVGPWDGLFEMAGDAAAVVEAIVSARDRLPDLTAIFFGDIISEECEISWIRQTDVSPILAAFPNLTHFGVRGGNGLSLGTPSLPVLRSLVVETGGLAAEVVREVSASNLPSLEHLELWLGTDEYGGTVTVPDLEKILSGSLFPRLAYLGLRDSDIADAVAVSVAKSPLLARIDILDLSMGTLGDAGVEALLASPALKSLKKLDIHHHYCTPEMVTRLEGIGIPVDVSEREDEDKYGRYVAVGE